LIVDFYFVVYLVGLFLTPKR